MHVMKKQADKGMGVGGVGGDAGVVIRTSSNKQPSDASKRLSSSLAEISKELDRKHKNVISKNSRSVVSLFSDLFSPDILTLRTKMKDVCERLLCLPETDVATCKRAEDLLWRKVFYDVISVMKQQKQHIQTNTASQMAWTGHLHSALAFYQHLLAKLHLQFQVLKYPQNVCDYIATPEFLESKSKQVTTAKSQWAAESSHRCLVFLGDIARYLDDVGVEDHYFVMAQRYYHQALLLYPDIGMPHNQLGTLLAGHTMANNSIAAAYHYIRCMCSAEPFEGAYKNLLCLVGSVRTKQHSKSELGTKYEKMHALTLRWLQLVHDGMTSRGISASAVTLASLLSDLDLMLGERGEESFGAEQYLIKGMTAFHLVLLIFMMSSTLRDTDIASSLLMSVFVVVCRHARIRLQQLVDPTTSTKISSDKNVVVKKSEESLSQAAAAAVECETGQAETVDAPADVPADKASDSEMEKVEMCESVVELTVTDRVNDSLTLPDSEEGTSKQLKRLLQNRRRRNSDDSCGSDISSDISSGGDNCKPDSEDAMSDREEISSAGGRGAESSSLSSPRNSGAGDLDFTQDTSNMSSSCSTTDMPTPDSSGTPTAASCSSLLSSLDRADSMADGKDSPRSSKQTSTELSSSCGKDGESGTRRMVKMLSGDSSMLWPITAYARWFLQHPHHINAPTLSSTPTQDSKSDKNTEKPWQNFVDLLNDIPPINDIKQLMRDEKLAAVDDMEAVRDEFVLREDVAMRGLSCVHPNSQERMPVPHAHLSHTHESESEACLRLLMLHDFAESLSKIKPRVLAFQVQADDVEEGGGSYQALTADDVAANLSAKQMQAARNMANLYVKSEMTRIQELEQRKDRLIVNPTSFSFCILDVSCVLKHLSIVKEMHWANTFRMVVPSVVLEELDSTKRENSESRKVSRFLQNTIFNKLSKQKGLQCQDTEMEVDKTKGRDRQLLDTCLAYRKQMEKQLPANQMQASSNVVALLVSNVQSPQAKLAMKNDIHVDSILDFHARWRHSCNLKKCHTDSPPPLPSSTPPSLEDPDEQDD